MAAWGYEFYLLVLKVSLTRSLGSWEILSALEDKIRIPARPCNILYLHACVCVCVVWFRNSYTYNHRQKCWEGCYFLPLFPSSPDPGPMWLMLGKTWMFVRGIVVLYSVNRELFRFQDEDDCVNEIFSILSSGRARPNVILAGKCGSRRQSAKSFSENIF